MCRFGDARMTRLFTLFRLSPLAESEPASPAQLVLAIAPWVLVAGLAMAMLIR
jgi:hypothetical protein